METLRQFVDALLGRPDQGEPDIGRGYHSKPDMVSGSYELRRIKLRRVAPTDGEPGLNFDWPETDFYEYYWAHQMYGTRISHFTSWLVRMMLGGARAWRKKQLSSEVYSPRLKKMLVTAWIAVPLAVIAGWIILRQPVAVVSTGGALTVGLVALWKFGISPMLSTTVTDVAGDAARYLDVTPQNVARRYDIIRGGIDMLKELHTKGDVQETTGEVKYQYERVVLVGHSLGSLIAYDLIRHYWAEINGNLRVRPKDFEGVERFDGGNVPPWGVPFDTDKDSVAFRDGQARCWQRINAWWLGQPSLARDLVQAKGRARWLVSDLVTIGSPLTYAALLLADGPDDLKEKQTLRELPTCPPDRSKHVNEGCFTVPLSEEADRFAKYDILGHQAPFAVTRWTNLYFPNDPIGGPLTPVFLKGIDEPSLYGPRVWVPGSAHVKYWKTKNHKPIPAAEPCVAQLRKILTRCVT